MAEMDRKEWMKRMKRRVPFAEGDRVELDVGIPSEAAGTYPLPSRGKVTGSVVFAGPVSFPTPKAHPVWVGVRLDRPYGNTTGALRGDVYFRVPRRYGRMVPLSFVRPLPKEEDPLLAARKARAQARAEARAQALAEKGKDEEEEEEEGSDANADADADDGGDGDAADADDVVFVWRNTECDVWTGAANSLCEGGVWEEDEPRRIGEQVRAIFGEATQDTEQENVALSDACLVVAGALSHQPVQIGEMQADGDGVWSFLEEVKDSSSVYLVPKETGSGVLDGRRVYNVVGCVESGGIRLVIFRGSAEWVAQPLQWGPESPLWTPRMVRDLPLPEDPPEDARVVLTLREVLTTGLTWFVMDQTPLVYPADIGLLVGESGRADLGVLTVATAAPVTFQISGVAPRVLGLARNAVYSIQVFPVEAPTRPLFAAQDVPLFSPSSFQAWRGTYVVVVDIDVRSNGSSARVEPLVMAMASSESVSIAWGQEPVCELDTYVPPPEEFECDHRLVSVALGRSFEALTCTKGTTKIHAPNVFTRTFSGDSATIFALINESTDTEIDFIWIVDAKDARLVRLDPGLDIQSLGGGGVVQVCGIVGVGAKCFVGGGGGGVTLLDEDVVLSER